MKRTHLITFDTPKQSVCTCTAPSLSPHTHAFSSQVLLYSIFTHNLFDMGLCTWDQPTFDPIITRLPSSVNPLVVAIHGNPQL